MAGRPVTIHGGQSGLYYGMITFAVLSAVLLGLSIFMLTKNKALENAATTATERLSRYGQAPEYYMAESTSRGRGTTVFAVVADEERKLATAVTGAPEDTAAAMKAKIDRAVADLAARHKGIVNPGDTLLSALLALSDAEAKSQSTIEANTVVLNDLDKDKEALTQQLKATREQFEGQVAQLGEQLQRAQDEKLTAIDQKDGQVKEMQAVLDNREQQLQKLQREGTTRERDLNIELNQSKATVGMLQKQVAAIKQTAFDPSKILTSADGKIVRAIPGSDIVYINLGAADRIKPGMGFEVFARNAEPSPNLRGKASLEVVNVMEETSECRVTRREPGQPLMENDIIVNLAYDRTRKPKFVVRGEFDLNYDGIMDYNGAEEISSLIRQWGGQVVDELDETVDYVVLGQAPKAPPVDDKATDVVREQARAKEVEGGKFVQLRAQAEKMGIPVVTQNQFLFLTGYGRAVGVTRH